MRYYDTAESLRLSIDSYFEKGATSRIIQSKDEFYTVKIYSITGLALWLGLPSKNYLVQLAKDPRFREVVEYGLTRIEQTYEEQLTSSSSTGAQFALKQFGWKDTNEIYHRTEQTGMDRFIGMTNSELLEYQKQLAREVLTIDDAEPITIKQSDTPTANE